MDLYYFFPVNFFFSVLVMARGLYDHILCFVQMRKNATFVLRNCWMLYVLPVSIFKKVFQLRRDAL